MKAHKALPALIVSVALLAAWSVVAALVHTPFLPSPQATAVRLVEGFLPYLAPAAWHTLVRALLGCLFAALIGIPFGYALAHWRRFRLAVLPPLAASQAIPGVAIAPLLTIWLGYGNTPIVVLCAFMVIFPVIVSSSLGFARIDREILQAARLDGARGFTLAYHIEFPLAAPAILAGLKTGFTLSITGAVVGEMIIGGDGLGLLLTSAASSGDVTGMFATIAILTVMAMSMYGLVSWVERSLRFSSDSATSSLWR